jgi:HlyD family secretion protein
MTRAVRIPLKLVLFLCAAAGIAAGIQASWQWYRGSASEPLFRTDHPTRGSLVANIVATGTIEPEEVIDVGAQVAGQILSFGRDPTDPNRTIDYASPVEQGTVLARIDDSLYAPEVEIARADLGLCLADVRHAESEIELERSKLHKTERDWERTKQLASAKSISQNDFDATQNAWEMAKASVTAAEADLEKAKRAVEKARGTLGKAVKNLGYCTIKSPVKGVIIDRRVNVGQTVVSSLNAPSLFLIAKDLRRLQIWVSVNESDIGNIYPGQNATFTVDAYPADVFHGTVGQIRLNATMTQNVVTYTVVVNVDNEDGKLDPYSVVAAAPGGANPGSSTLGSPTPVNPTPVNQTQGTRNRPDVPAGDKLLPYLTANLQFKVDERTDALLVPNAALHYRPQAALVAPEYRAVYEQGLRRATVEEGAPVPSTKGRRIRATVWVPDGNFVRPIKVRVGLTDGLMTEVVDVIKDNLTPETEIVTGENQSAASQEGTVNPFGPSSSKKK